MVMGAGVKGNCGQDPSSIVGSVYLDPPSRIKYFFFPRPQNTRFHIVMTRTPRLARDAPLRRSQVEETVSIKLPAKRAARKSVSKSVKLAKKKSKQNSPPAKVTKPAKKSTADTEATPKTGSTRLILFVLI